MKCLACAGEARDRTPRNFDGYVIECPKEFTMDPWAERVGQTDIANEPA
jgi:hypothetical protein